MFKIITLLVIIMAVHQMAAVPQFGRKLLSYNFIMLD